MAPTGQPPYRRSRLIVNRPLQYRFIGVLLLVVLALSLIALTGIYLTLWTTLHLFELERDPVTVALFTTVGLSIAVQLLIVSPFVVWLGIIVTHKVAGPLVRIQAGLSQLSEGKFDLHLTLRKGDALVELAESVNRLAAYLRSRS